MGYRNLLKKYMAHVSSIVGGNLVELAVLTNSLRSREISELKMVAAELNDAPSVLNDGRLNQYLNELLHEGRIELDQLAAVQDLVAGTDQPELNKTRLERIVHALAPTNAEGDTQR